MKELPTTREWRALAKIDPLFAVASWPGKRGSWNEGDFYATGREDWAQYSRYWADYAGALSGTCVEIGCGAGRMTSPIAGTFDRVHAIDVSRDMVDLAAKVCPENVTFSVVDGLVVPLDDASADAVFSCFVLEHLTRPAHVLSYLTDAFRVLGRGGTLMVQIALSRERPLEAVRLVGRSTLMLGLRRLHRFGVGPVRFSGREYGRTQVRSWLDGIGFANVELREFANASNGSLVSFWLARRP